MMITDTVLQNNSVELTLQKTFKNWAPGRRVRDAVKEGAGPASGAQLQLVLVAVILLRVTSYTDLPRKKREAGTAAVSICACKNVLQVPLPY